MARSIKVFIWLALILCLAIPTRAAQAIIINYEATDLEDTTAGEDLWQYAYTVSEYTFDLDTGFTIYFDAAVALLPLSSHLDWDILTWDPDPIIPDYGAYDALALGSNASLTDPFTVNFVWMGEGTPITQSFDVYSLNEYGGLDILESGQTIAASAPVPEPATLFLLGAGLVSLSGLTRCKSKINKKG